MTRDWSIILGCLLFAGLAMGQEPAESGPVLAQQGPSIGRPAPPPPPVPGEQVATDRGYGSIGVETLGDQRSIIIEGPKDQVEALQRVIEEIDRLSIGADPEVRVVLLRNAASESLAKLLNKIYESRDAARPGGGLGAAVANATRTRIGILPIAQPNAVVIVAPRLDLEPVARFAQELDAETARSGAQFKIFSLKQAPALQVTVKLQQFFSQRQDAADLRVRVEVVADERTNSVLLFAGPEDLKQAEALIKQLDGDSNSAVNELKIFKLRNAIATELAVLLEQAILTRSLATAVRTTGVGAGAGGAGLGGLGAGGAGGAGAGQGGLGQGAARPPGAAGATGANNNIKSAKLRFLSTDRSGKPVESGILEDITIHADPRTNSLVITAPNSSMGLVTALIEQLDSLPSPLAELKVFTLRNSDPEAMLQTLQQVFGDSQSSTGQQPGGQGGSSTQQVSFSIPGQAAEMSRVPLSFGIDVRTNSVIASGSRNDLIAVEAVLLKLDANSARERKTFVYRLRNLTANEAATALNDFLQSQTQIAESQQGRISFQEQISREVSIVPEVISNSLLISSTPRFYDEILRIVEEIDMRPPQVVIQVLIATVTLTDNEDFGVELGTQSSVLFDRSLQVRNSAIGAQQNGLLPGFNFNSTDPLQSPVGAPASEVGLQSLTNFALGRGNPTAGFGGLILAASSDNVSVLLRALKRQQRLDVLSRPQIMTLDNQQAFIQIGQQIPIVTASQTTVQGGVVNSVEFRDVGIILQVTPRISPDGVVVMRVDPTVSSRVLGDGIPIASGGSGAPVLAPIIDTTRAQTTVSAADGQTVVIGGLITKSVSIDERKMPVVGDWPVVGWAFKTRLKTVQKRELLIILTPHVVYNECDAERIKQVEARRMNWILSDVEKVHGGLGDPPPDCPIELPEEQCGPDGKPLKKEGPFMTPIQDHRDTRIRMRPFRRHWFGKGKVLPGDEESGETADEETPAASPGASPVDEERPSAPSEATETPIDPMEVGPIKPDPSSKPIGKKAASPKPTLRSLSVKQITVPPEEEGPLLVAPPTSRQRPGTPPSSIPRAATASRTREKETR